MTGAGFGLGKFRMPQSVPGSKCYPCFKIRFPKYLSWVWGTSVFPWRLYVPLRPKVLTGGWWLPVKTSEESREADFLCNWPLKDGVWSTHPLCSWKSGCKRPRFDPWVRKVPWRRKRQPAPVCLPGKPRGQRSLAGYSPWGRTESDTRGNGARSALCLCAHSRRVSRLQGVWHSSTVVFIGKKYIYEDPHSPSLCCSEGNCVS